MIHRDMATVIVTEPLAEEPAAWLAERCRVVHQSSDDRERFGAAIAAADGLIVRTYTRVDGALLAGAPHLRVVGRAGVGFDNIDVAACRRRGVEVVFTPEANTQAVVEYVVCLLADALRRRIVLAEAVAPQEWHRLRSAGVWPREMREMTLGILGLGRIGRRIAQVGGAIGFRVLYNDLLEIPRAERGDAEPVAVEALFEEADVLTVHVDGRASNRSFINARLLKRIKSDAVFINTSRGFVVDNLALAARLRANPKALAMLDVHEPEPFDEDYPLLGLPNARLYPHLASRTETAMRNMSWVVRDVVAVLAGGKPRFPAHETADGVGDGTADSRG